MTAEAPTSDPAPQAKARIFISYSRKDMAFADRLESALRARGFRPLLDRAEIYAFEEWWKRIEALIGGADTVVFVLSPDGIASDVTAREVSFAASLNKRFAPVVCRRVDDKKVPVALRKLNFIFFDDPDQFDKNADRLAEALNTDISWIRQHTEYGEAERRWSAAGRPNGLLLHFPTLEIAEHWIISRPRGAPEPTKEIQAFIAASRRGARVTQRRRRQAQALTYTLLIGIIAGLVGWINQGYLKEQLNWYWAMRPYRVANMDTYVLTAAAERALRPGTSFRECAKDCPEMMIVPAGQFMMGSPANEAGRDSDEDPQHRVTFARPFAVSKFEVTFADWDACVSVGGCPQEDRANDYGWGRGGRPVVYVSWDDAQAYGAWLSGMTGKTYRLLTEAEWEYAARAGATTTYSWGEEIGRNNANCNGCGSQWDNRQAAAVGSFAANAFGLHDMHGNAWEWVQDCLNQTYNGAPVDGRAWTAGDCKYRVVRGGSWASAPRDLRAATRHGGAPNSRQSGVGFRVGRILEHWANGPDR